MNSAEVTGSISRRSFPKVRRWIRASTLRLHHSISPFCRAPGVKCPRNSWPSASSCKKPVSTKAIGNASFRGYLDPATAETGVVFENEGDAEAAGKRMGNLFSSAVRWAGSNAIVPLRWMFKKKLSAGDDTDCLQQDPVAGGG